MPPESLPYEIDEKRGFVLFTVERQPSLEDWALTLDRVLHDPRYQNGFGVVSDRRGVPPPDGEYVRAAIRALADRFDGHAPMRWATVVPPGQVAFGMGRMAELVGESAGVAFRVFPTLEEAIVWVTTRR